MQEYVSHKRVTAAKIVDFKLTETGGLLRLEGGISTIADEDWLNKHQPESGGYFVRYEDGYESFSPAEAFEGGYTAVAELEERDREWEGSERVFNSAQSAIHAIIVSGLIGRDGDVLGAVKKADEYIALRLASD